MTDRASGKFDPPANREQPWMREAGTTTVHRVIDQTGDHGRVRDWDQDRDHCLEYDFGPLRVQVPAGARPRMADPDALYCDAVFFDFPDGTVRLSVLAAPREHRLWPERAEEIATAQASLGNQVRSFSGEWGRELQIIDATTMNWVIGLDGPRWMLLGRSTCRLEADTDRADSGRADSDLGETMRAMIRTSVVVRGDEPFPVRTPLPLKQRGGADAHDAPEQRVSPYSGAVTLIVPTVSAATADAVLGDGAVVASPDPDVRHGGGPLAAAGSVNSASRPDQWPSPPPGSIPRPREQLAVEGDDERAAWRSRGGPLVGAAVVVLIGVSAAVLAVHASMPRIGSIQLAAPPRGGFSTDLAQPPTRYPHDGYPLPPQAPPAQKVPAVTGQVPPVPTEPRPAPRVGPHLAPAPTRSDPAPTQTLASPVATATATATATRSSTAHAAAPPAASGSDRSATSHGYSGTHPNNSRSLDNGGDHDGLLTVVSNDVLQVAARPSLNPPGAEPVRR